MKHFRLTILFLLFTFQALISKSQLTGPRKEQGKSVRLTKVPSNATPAEIQALFRKNRYLYFGPGEYKIGNLHIDNWKNGTIWGAGRLTTVLRGNIIINESTDVTLGNMNIINNSNQKDNVVIDVVGASRSDLTFMNALVSAGHNGIALRLKTPGQAIIQGCNLKASDVGLSIEHPLSSAHVFGGNLQYNRIHIRQVAGHLDARAFGMQGNRGDADIIIQSPSPAGFHLIEGLRSEGNNGLAAKEMLLKVPETEAAVNVALRANTLGGMTQYAEYMAGGTLLLLENVNYPGSEDKSSLGVICGGNGAKIISYGNKYGLSYDAAPGPFVTGASATVQSMGDMWMLPNTTNYSKAFNEPITKAGMLAAGKKVPSGIIFLTPADSFAVSLPDLPLYKVAPCPRISNLAQLMLNVKDFGAIPGDGIDDRAAIQRALDAAEKGGIYQPIYFPAGIYELSERLFLDHLAGGGFWGDGNQQSILYSTTGNGVVTSDGAGYSAFVDIGFVNKPGAETRTTDFDWINPQSPDKKRGNTGAALQATMFYRSRFENGSIGMAIGKNRMGDGFMMVDCIFKNNRSTKGEGAAYLSENFNVLTNPLVHCRFENVDCAVWNAKGSFNFYGNSLLNIQKAALKFFTIVGNGFAIVNNDMDASPVPLFITGHSSAKAHLLIEKMRIKAPVSTSIGSAYTLGGSVMFMHSSLPNRTINNGGGIGDNTLIVYKTTAAGISVAGRAHGYVSRTTPDAKSRQGK